MAKVPEAWTDGAVRGFFRTPAACGRDLPACGVHIPCSCRRGPYKALKPGQTELSEAFFALRPLAEGNFRRGRARKKPSTMCWASGLCGERGIRTPGTVTRSAV